MKKIWREFKLEITLAAASLLFITLDKIPHINFSCVFKWISNVNNGLNTSDLITFFTITIGIYVSILCIISTSQSTVIRALINHNKEQGLGIVVVGGILENMALILYILLSPCFYYKYFILIISIIISVISFIKFVFILYRFYNISNKEIIKSIDQEEEDKKALFSDLAILKDNTHKTNKK